MPPCGAEAGGIFVNISGCSEGAVAQVRCSYFGASPKYSSAWLEAVYQVSHLVPSHGFSINASK